MQIWPGEDAGLVFSSDSAKTHLLDQFAAQILEIASSQPVDAETIFMALESDESGPSDVADNQTVEINAIQKSLEALEQSGFMRRIE